MVLLVDLAHQVMDQTFEATSVTGVILEARVDDHEAVAVAGVTTVETELES